MGMALIAPHASALQDVAMPGDRYRIQARLVGDLFWADSNEHEELFPAEWAARLVRELNAVAQGIVYRSVLVRYV